jgi:glycosyltransferase involved in cell wall biosynthesis
VITRQYAGLQRFEIIDGIPVFRIPIPGPKPAASLAFTAGSLFQILRTKPDLLHAHELLSPATTGVLAKRLFGIPLVAKVLRGGVLGDIRKLKTRRSGPGRLTAIIEHVDAFAVISNEIEDELRAAGASDGQLQRIPNGVDLERYTPADPSQKKYAREALGLGSGPMAVFTGRLSPEKRVDLLVNSWLEIRKSHPEAQLVLVGTGPEESFLKGIAGAGVHFPGRVADVTPYLRAADLFVLPSETEGLSNALLEGMASGLACVASAVGGAVELIQDRNTGWLIQPGSPEPIIEAVATLFADPELRRRLGSAARAVVAQRYDLSVVAQQLRALYDQLLQVD